MRFWFRRVRVFFNVTAPRVRSVGRSFFFCLLTAPLLCASQVLSNKEKVFLRIANDRGWTYARNPVDDSILFEQISGEIVADT